MVHHEALWVSPELKMGERASASGEFDSSAANPQRRSALSWLRRTEYLGKANRTAEAVGSRLVPRPATVLAIFDFFLLAGANAGFVLGIYGRLALPTFAEAAIVTLCVIGINLLFLYAMGGYRRDAIVNKAATLSGLPIVIGLASVVFFLLLHFGFSAVFPEARVYLSVSRCMTVALIAAGASLSALVISRYVFFAMLRRQWFRRRILVIGRGARASHLVSLMTQDSYAAHAELVPVDEAILTPVAPGSGNAEFISHGTLEKLAVALGVDEIVIASDDPQSLPFESLLACKVHGVPITEFQMFIERETGRVDLRFVDPSYLVYSSGFQMRAMDRFAKRSLDIGFSMFLLLVCLPVLAAAMVAVWLEDKGAVFYRQERVTQGGRIFWLYKLRTMRVDAEKDGARWASKTDSRITRVGAFLRRTRLDEIPQLFNILKGDMSLVGPRPERPVFVEEIGKEVQLFVLRHGVKAGLTGWAQINYPYGASIDDAARKLEYDLYYMKNYSWLRDISIILQTIRIVLLQEGAR